MELHEENIEDRSYATDRGWIDELDAFLYRQCASFSEEKEVARIRLRHTKSTVYYDLSPAHEKAVIEAELLELSSYDEGIEHEKAKIEAEFWELCENYKRIIHKISHSNLVLKWSVKGHIPTDKLIEFGRLNNKSTETELKDLLESERNTMLKLIICMAVDAMVMTQTSQKTALLVVTVAAYRRQ